MAVIKLNLSGHENQALTEQGFIFPGALHVDLSDKELPNKVVEFLKNECGLNSDSMVVCALPGLAPLAVIVVTAIHGLTGTFPVIVPLVRSENGFVPAKPVELQDFRNEVARTNRSNIVTL